MHKQNGIPSVAYDNDLAFLGDAPVLYHCHHFNLFLDQSVDDALGPKVGPAVRFAAAREASYQLLASLVRAADAVTPAERVALAEHVFASMGQGRLRIDAPQGVGKAVGEHLHYGQAWFEKYGTTVRRRSAVDTFAAGFAAAAVDVAYDLPPLSSAAKEERCVAMRAPRCEFTIGRGEAEEARPRVDRAAVAAASADGSVPAGLHEDAIAAIAATLRAFLAGVESDDNGLIRAFGVYVTMHLAGYYNRITYDTITRVQAAAPKMTEVLEMLFRESGHVCVFNTFGGILMSPEWEGAVGTLTGDPAEIVTGGVAIARALGFGRWRIREHVPGERLVIDAPATYESPYYGIRHGEAVRPTCYFLQGAALAIMQLAERVNWSERPALTQAFYNELFRGGLPWRVEQTSCRVRGDDRCTVVVSRS